MADAVTLPPMPVPAAPRTVVVNGEDKHVEIDVDALWTASNTDAGPMDLDKYSCMERPLPGAPIPAMKARCALLCNLSPTVIAGRIQLLERDAKRLRLGRILFLLAELDASGADTTFATWPGGAPGPRPPVVQLGPLLPAGTAPAIANPVQPPAGAQPGPVAPVQFGALVPQPAPVPGAVVMPPNPQPPVVPPQQQQSNADAAIDALLDVLETPDVTPAAVPAPVANNHVDPADPKADRHRLKRLIREVVGGKAESRSGKHRRKRRHGHSRSSGRRRSPSPSSDSSYSDDSDHGGHSARDKLEAANRRLLARQGRFRRGVLTGGTASGAGVRRALPAPWHKQTIKGLLGIKFVDVITGAAGPARRPASTLSVGVAVANAVYAAQHAATPSDALTEITWADAFDMFTESVLLVFHDVRDHDPDHDGLEHLGPDHASNLAAHRHRCITHMRVFGIGPVVTYDQMVRDHCARTFADLRCLTDFGELFEAKTACFAGLRPILCQVRGCFARHDHDTREHDKAVQARAAGARRPAPHAHVQPAAAAARPPRPRHQPAQRPAQPRAAPAPRQHHQQQQQRPAPAAQVCKKFNLGQPCFKRPCHFQHVCSRCRGPHPETPAGGPACTI